MRTPDAGLQRLKENLGRAHEPSRLIGVRLDLDDPASIESAIARILDTVGAPDGLVHNAGLAGAGAVEEMPVAVVEQIFTTNVFGPIRLTKGLLPVMRAAGRGRVVVVSSSAATSGIGAVSAYGASKSALERWAEALSLEIAPFGLGVSVLVAGTFKTDILELTQSWKDASGPYAAAPCCARVRGRQDAEVRSQSQLGSRRWSSAPCRRRSRSPGMLSVPTPSPWYAATACSRRAGCSPSPSEPWAFRGRHNAQMFTLRFDMRAPTWAAPIEDLYAAAIEMAAWAETRGAVVAVLSEHHGTDDRHLPSPLILATAMAARTEQLAILVAAAVLPFYEPVRLAEDIAVLDIISRGRVAYVFGVGHRQEEYDHFGLDFQARGMRAEERVATLLGLLRWRRGRHRADRSKAH